MRIDRKLVEICDRVVNRKLDKDGNGPRLILTLPPRHGKSELVSKYFPAWALARWPWLKVMFGSYEANFARSWGAKARDVRCDFDWMFPDGKIKRGYAAMAKEWETDGGGQMMTAGVGGAFTGKGAHLLIIDDPVKSDQEANSKVYREKVWNWYRSTVSTRLEPGGAIIVIMTRWHADDLVGRLLQAAKGGDDGTEEKGDQFEVIDFPALYEGHEIDGLGRTHGQALWPERYNEVQLGGIRRRIGLYYWGALFQQKPRPDQGGFFNRQFFKYATAEGMGEMDYRFLCLHQPDGTIKRWAMSACRWYQTIDTASKEKTQNDYTVFMTFALTPDYELVVYHVHRERMQITQMFDTLKKFKNDIFTHLEIQFIEEASSGTNLLQIAIQNGLTVLPVFPTGSKENRVSSSISRDKERLQYSTPIAVAYQNGQVYHMRGSAWLMVFEDELIDFNKGAFDDQVDCLAYGWIVANNFPSVEDPAMVLEGKRVGDKEQDDDDEFYEVEERSLDGFDNSGENPLEQMKPKGKTDDGAPIHPWE